MDAHMRTAGVRILDIPYHADIEYTYYIPESFPDVSRGNFLLVPFGQGNKKIPAVIVSTSKTMDYRELKPVFKVYTDGIRLTEKMMRLADFLCGRTFCSFGDAARRLIPQDLIPQTSEYFAVCENFEKTSYASRHAATIAYIEENGAVLREKLLSDTGISPETLSRLCREGVLMKTTRACVSEGASTTLVTIANGADASIL